MLGKNLITAASGNAAAGDYEISRSLRFNSADSAYLARTPGTAGDRKTWTWSGWVKRSNVVPANILQFLFSALSGSDRLDIIFYDSDNGQLGVYGNVTSAVQANTNALLRDFSAWYHIVVVFDASNATAADRLKIYINGVIQTLTYVQGSSFFDANYPVNSTGAHYIGEYSGGGYHFDGYLADINFIDGQALTPSSFGETDETTGVWKPIAYAGTYGTNGFHLDFSDNTSTTTLGYDAAGSNDWTLNNFSVTAGAGNDSLVDSPTRYGTDTGAGGEVRGNYATMNPLANFTGTLSNGNLTFVTTIAGNDKYCQATIKLPSTGKWYWENTISIADNSNARNIQYLTNSQADSTGTGTTYAYITSNSTTFNSSATVSNTLNEIIRTGGGGTVAFAYDADIGSWWVYKNGAINTASTANVTNLSNANGDLVFAIKEGSGTVSATNNLNFGQRPFAYTAPSGFKALCTTNLPDPTVVQGDDYFNTVLYDGTGSSQSITTVGFTPDFTWIKETNAAADHALYDAVRGVQNQLESNTTTGETTEATGLTAFVTGGFTVGALAQVNTSGDNYVAWNWKANGAGSSNTAGTISSTVSVNTTSGFSIVTYTGTGANANVGHGLGVAPSIVIVKSRSYSPSAWRMYNINLANAATTLDLNSTAAADGTNASSFNSTAPTSSVFSLGTADNTNRSGETYVAYCFAEVEGFSKFGSYVGNASTDGVFVYTGFRPAFILVKNTAEITNWFMWDNKISPYNPASVVLLANTSDSLVSNRDIDILSNGFKARKNDQNYNSTNTQIFMAFAENPFKTSLAR